MTETPKVLFISYDGLTDPLGQSQILPYILGLASKGYRFSIISFEKKERFRNKASVIKEQIRHAQIDWHPLPFTTFPPIIAKYRDKNRMFRKAQKLYKKDQFPIIHCRSYIAAECGLALKRKYGVKFLFDMRGFWVDERVEGHIWNLKNPFFKQAYRIYKDKEAGFISNADWIVSLTEAAISEMKTWPSWHQAPTSVIPCSADFNLFRIPDTEQQMKSRQLHGFSPNDLVIGYLGSIGTWYMLNEMLLFLAVLKKKIPASKFLFVTPGDKKEIFSQAKAYGIDRKDIQVVFSERKDLPANMACMDLALSFIKPSYSKIASSPTKLGEFFAMGIPVIANAQVGDVEQIVKNTTGGCIIEDFSVKSFENAIEQIPALQDMSREKIRKKAFEYYNLETAVEKYYLIYNSLVSARIV